LVSVVLQFFAVV